MQQVVLGPVSMSLNLSQLLKLLTHYTVS